MVWLGVKDGGGTCFFFLPDQVVGHPVAELVQLLEGPCLSWWQS